MEISLLPINLLLLLFFFLLLFISPVVPEYTRPPPRPLSLRSHNRSDSHPQQVHISLAGKDYMRVSWITSDKKSPPVVEYGTTPGKYGGAATGESTSYHYFFYSSGEIHHVKIGPLKPTTTYYYRCGGGGPEFSFRTPPSGFPIEFAVAGDLGQTEWTESTLEHVGSTDYDVFLLPGDLSYADTQQPLWDSFGRLVEPYASTRPWMVTEGNHEIEIFPIIYPQGFKAYNARWVMPYQESKSTSNLYYSFDVAGAHVVMLGSYTDFDSNSDQYKWLQSDLAQAALGGGSPIPSNDDGDDDGRSSPSDLIPPHSLSPNHISLYRRGCPPHRIQGVAEGLVGLGFLLDRRDRSLRQEESMARRRLQRRQLQNGFGIVDNAPRPVK